LESLVLPTGVAVAADTAGAPVILFPNEWSLRYFQDRNPGLALLTTPARAGGKAAAV
jgi:peptide chain release factor 3